MEHVETPLPSQQLTTPAGVQQMELGARTLLRWREVGTEESLGSDNDVAEFLLRLYDTREDATRPVSHCVCCNAPLPLICAACQQQPCAPQAVKDATEAYEHVQNPSCHAIPLRNCMARGIQNMENSEFGNQAANDTSITKKSDVGNPLAKSTHNVDRSEIGSHVVRETLSMGKSEAGNPSARRTVNIDRSETANHISKTAQSAEKSRDHVARSTRILKRDVWNFPAGGTQEVEETGAENHAGGGTEKAGKVKRNHLTVDEQEMENQDHIPAVHETNLLKSVERVKCVDEILVQTDGLSQVGSEACSAGALSESKSMNKKIKCSEACLHNPLGPGGPCGPWPTGTFRTQRVIHACWSTGSSMTRTNSGTCEEHTETHTFERTNPLSVSSSPTTTSTLQSGECSLTDKSSSLTLPSAEMSEGSNRAKGPKVAKTVNEETVVKKGRHSLMVFSDKQEVIKTSTQSNKALSQCFSSIAIEPCCSEQAKSQRRSHDISSQNQKCVTSRRLSAKERGVKIARLSHEVSSDNSSVHTPPSLQLRGGRYAHKREKQRGKSARLVHRKWSDRQYVCSVCELKCSCPSALTRHMRTHTGERPFVCGVCGKALTDAVSLRAHSELHQDSKSFVCEVCGTGFSRKDTLKKHMRTHTGQRPYKCRVCDASFAQGTALKRHMYTHSGERPYLCELCSKTYTTPGALTRHRQAHENAREYECHICGMAFNTAVVLKQHVRGRHSMEKPFKCDQCDFVCALKWRLTMHVASHSDSKPFECVSCGQRFKKSWALKKHQAIHTRGKLYSCNVCQASFDRQAHLTVHRKIHDQTASQMSLH